MATPFKVTGSREVYKNPWIQVREDSIVRPNGSAGVYAIVTMSPGSSVLAVTPDRKVILVRQYRHAIARETIEVVSGAIDPGETPLAAAQRELQEEAGYTSGNWIDAGRLDPFTSLIDSPNYMFIAFDIQRVDYQADEEEAVEPELVPLAEAVQMAVEGKITHGASCALLLKAHANALSLR